MGAHRTIGPRLLVPVCFAAVVATGCGSGTPQDSDEPSGKFPVQVVNATFPAKQRLATTSNMRIVVRNPGPKKIPIISVTVKCRTSGANGSGGSPSGSGGSGGGFAYRTSFRGVADPVRPQFVVNTLPTRTPRNYDHGRLDPLERSSSYVDTFPLGPLAAGRSATFEWNVTAVKSGPYRVCYQVNAGLDGKAKAVPARAGERIAGQFTGQVADRPPQAHIGENGKTVVEGKAVSGSAP
jgi:hypothetical protein